MSIPVHAFAAHEAGGPLTPFEYSLPPLEGDDVDIAVESCGICHSDLSMLDAEWGRTRFPLVPGHEVTGRIIEVGPAVKHLKAGDRVGLGWQAGSCLHCGQCMDGHHNLCRSVRPTIIGRHGGFADRVRAQAAFVCTLPEGLDAASAGPLFCGGITVFSPIVEFGVKPTDRVGVVGIGGLGHLALQFLNAWGCEVTAFTSSASKQDEAVSLGAHKTVSSRDADALKPLAGQFDFLLVTANVSLDWPLYLSLLSPRGRLHVVGAVLEPMAVPVFSLMGGQKSVSSSPVGSPQTIRTMLEFCARHDIRPQVETYPMADVNAALDRLRSGAARYRVVLTR
ncbi:NAD(P)-dependent alcohol dehydrogenase [Flagellatimonas centrodinii]|uniref:NADPH-dependent aldehyde reductase Ahr n=1 Tax=Flagellatimonas centrodinii TaxID=2806210 RepID=UPI001FF01C7D|nr:NAD(P)-dependent alcohol dehydrogenase [Flagellatimonas centrodinii]ULQ48223.1 NAD(P)-dependent alcohol dehydrogenase [Flagellatimonas centrodinii]